MSDTQSIRPSPSPVTGPMLLLAGLAVAALAWLLPVNLTSVSPALLRAAGEGTPSLAGCGMQMVEAQKSGPASIVLAAARTIGDPVAPSLAQALGQLTAQQ